MVLMLKILDTSHHNDRGLKVQVLGEVIMNSKAEDAANKILLAFEWGGIAPLEPEKFAKVQDHVRSILGRAMETEQEKKHRKWESYQRAMNEKSIGQE